MSIQRASLWEESLSNTSSVVELLGNIVERLLQITLINIKVWKHRLNINHDHDNELGVSTIYAYNGFLVQTWPVIGDSDCE
jgi:hypothetical protein